MVIENKILDELNSSKLGDSKSVHILHSIINTLNFDFLESNFEIVIENCIINNFSIHSCWFVKGLTFKNNHIMNYVDYQMGGHNEMPVNITGNIFHDFVSFFDCHFENQLVLKNNLFLKGSNLLGNKDEGFANIFNSDVIIENNMGNIDLDGLGR
jgi:hypothetical protein